MKKSVEPRWNQTFMYSPVHRREFRERMLELTVWDQARVREEESQFLGEVKTHLEHIEPNIFQMQSFIFALKLSQFTADTMVTGSVGEATLEA